MTGTKTKAPHLRAPTFEDFNSALRDGLRDFARQPLIGFVLSLVYVVAGLAMGAITWATGHTFWLILLVLGFPLVGALTALGFYEVSRRDTSDLPTILSAIWAHRLGQLPWLAVIIVVIFLFWFFLGHMIFALFLGLAPMTHVSSSLGVLLSSQGLMMLGFGTLIGAVFATLVFSISVMGMPMLLDRDVDFVTAMVASLKCVAARPVLFGIWATFLAMITLIAMLPAFLGLFVATPVLGHASWHLYARLRVDPGQNC